MSAGALSLSAPRGETADADAEYLPLYAASVLLHLSTVGAVASTITEPLWLPLWAALTIFAHVASWSLRRSGIPAAVIYVGVGVISTIWLFMAVGGDGAIAGISGPLVEAEPEFGLMILIASMAVLRCFALRTTNDLLFGVVPALAVLGLAGGSNPNIEIPIFFVLILFSSVFSIIYIEQLRRPHRSGARAAPLSVYVLVSWLVMAVVFTGGALFAVLSRPMLTRLTPYAMPTLTRTQQTFTETVRQTRAAVPVGAGPIYLSPTPVFEVIGGESGLYRTAVAMHYTGQGWNMSESTAVMDSSDSYRMEYTQQGRPRAAEVRLFLVPPDRQRVRRVATRTLRHRLVVLDRPAIWIPTLGRAVEIGIAADRLLVDPGSGVARGDGWIVVGQPIDLLTEAPEPTPEQLRAAPSIDQAAFPDRDVLGVPYSAAPVAELAQQVTATATNDYDRVLAILSHIERTCPYTLDEEPTPAGADAVVHYLFKSKRGACDLAGSAAALMCRSVGIPARVALGYLVDEPLVNGGGFLIREQDAHLWLEAYFEGYGWVPFNPSPPLGSGEEVRRNPLMSILARYFDRVLSGRIDSVLLALLLVATLLLGLRTLLRALAPALATRRRETALMRQGGPLAVAVLYQRATQALDRAGWPRRGHTPAELRAVVTAVWGGEHPATEALCRLTALYARSNFANRALADDVAEMRRAMRDLQRHLPRRMLTPRRLFQWLIGWSGDRRR